MSWVPWLWLWCCSPRRRRWSLRNGLRGCWLSLVLVLLCLAAYRSCSAGETSGLGSLQPRDMRRLGRGGMHQRRRCIERHLSWNGRTPYRKWRCIYTWCVDVLVVRGCVGVFLADVWFAWDEFKDEEKDLLGRWEVLIWIGDFYCSALFTVTVLKWTTAQASNWLRSLLATLIPMELSRSHKGHCLSYNIIVRSRTTNIDNDGLKSKRQEPAYFEQW